MNRGRSGTNGARKSAISRLSVSMNGRSLSVTTPARSISVLSCMRAQDQKGILAEERIPSDMLAAFNALEQEGVVRVLGNPEKRRYRRQQIGDDFLADGDERPAPRQLLEIFKRRDLHRL